MIFRTLALRALILAGLTASGCGRATLERVETTGAVAVRVEPARRDTLRASVTVGGTVVPSPGADWTITAPEAARIVELPRAEGDAVAAGDLLVRFEIPSLTSTLAASEAEIGQARVRLETARAAAVRLAGLLERGIAAQREVEQARRDEAEAQAALDQAESGLDAARLLAARAVVRARFAGIVAGRWHSAGDLVDAGTSDPILRVIDPRRLEVVAAVPVADLGHIVPGRPARVFSPAGGPAIETAVLTGPASVDPAVATANVRLGPLSESALAAGTPVQAEIVTVELEDVLVVPAAAIVRDGAETCLFVAGTDGKAHRRTVSLGLSALDRVEVTGGLTAGENVILSGNEPLPDGAEITTEK